MAKRDAHAGHFEEHLFCFGKVIFPVIGIGFDQLDMGTIDQLLSRVWKIHCYTHAND